MPNENPFIFSGFLRVYSYDRGMSEYRIPEQPPEAGWDLHCHTAFSDGTETPRTLVELAKKRGLHGIAITDHDTTAGWVSAQEAASAMEMPLLRGTEITAEHGGLSVHMLAYQYDPRNRHICDLFARTRAERMNRTKRMVERIARDYPITWDSVLAQVKEGERTTIGRPHIADALVAAGVYATRSDAFAGVVSGKSHYYIPTPSPSAVEVIHAVADAGGVSVIAHAADPSRNPRVLNDGELDGLADAGLDGIEVWHRGNPPEERTRLLELARRRQLLVTGGSDWHGSGKPNRLGEFLTDDATVREIVSRGAIPLWGAQFVPRTASTS